MTSPRRFETNRETYTHVYTFTHHHSPSPLHTLTTATLEKGGRRGGSSAEVERRASSHMPSHVIRRQVVVVYVEGEVTVPSMYSIQSIEKKAGSRRDRGC